MTMTNHFVTGAVIALVVKQPALALPLAVLSHFLLDAAPHYGEGKVEDEYTRSKMSWVVTAVDVVVGLSFLTWLLVQGQYYLVVGAMAAFLPDIAWVYRFARHRLTKASKARSRLSQFHEDLQHEYPWGIAVELPYLAVTVAVFMKLLSS